MKPSVYIETSVVSYYTARLSRDPVVAGHQATTRHWWEHRRTLFRTFISDFVLREAGAGDPSAAARRLAAISGMVLLELPPEVGRLSTQFEMAGIVPHAKMMDALHVAAASVHGMDYLVTWNCSHIANAEMRDAINKVCTKAGYRSPVICTPEELMGVGA
jgi:predicted nucleic acid-binding protein